MLIRLFLFIVFTGFSIFDSYSQTNEAAEIFLTPIGKNFDDISDAAKLAGYVVVNSDEEDNGRVTSYEFINKNKPNLGYALKCSSATQICHAASFNVPLTVWDKTVMNLDHQGERQGVYFHWKFPKQGYEVMLSKDTDNGVFYILMFKLKE